MPFVRSFLAVLALTCSVHADVLRTLDNKSIEGTVVSVNDREVSIKDKEGKVVAVPLENVIALDIRPVKGVPGGTSFTDIRLVDDTALVCASYAIKGKTVEATLLSGQAIKIPLASVVSILRGAQDGELKKKWDDLTAQSVKRDRVVLYTGGEVNALEGTIIEADADGAKIAFRPVDGIAMSVSIGKLQGLIFYREAVAAGPKPVCLVYDVVGNAVAAVKVVAEREGEGEGQGDRIKITTTIPGVTIECAAASIARFDYNMGKLAFLSDMVPSKVIEKSAVGLIVAYRRDVNLDGEPIVLDRSYAKGLSLHAYTELEFDLKGRFKHFTAVLGVDPRSGSESQAKVTIEVDGRILFSDKITAANVVPVNLDITKGNTLRIVVSSYNLLDLHDHVTIANPKVTQ
jgi:hypothetical protein